MNRFRTCGFGSPVAVLRRRRVHLDYRKRKLKHNKIVKVISLIEDISGKKIKQSP